jgi:hypothetical protein
MALPLLGNRRSAADPRPRGVESPCDPIGNPLTAAQRNPEAAGELRGTRRPCVRGSSAPPEAHE